MTQAESEDGASASELVPGSNFGAYEIIRKLGEGGMGAVYEARRQGLDKRVALKVLTSAENATMATRFVQEARIAASLEHPHVVDCFDVGVVDGTPFLAMELLEGESLKDRLARGPMSVTEASDLFLPLCSAVAAAHDRGIVHRDLKPDNIFLARKLRQVVPKVLDFGIAKARSVAGKPGVTQTATILGTPHYMSPEQANDSKGVDPLSDQFSLGAILWECLVGRVLFDGDTIFAVLMKVVGDPIAPPSSAAPTVPEAMDQVVLRLLCRTPEGRFPSVRALGMALLPFASPGERARWSAEFDGVDQPAAPVPVSVPPAVVAPSREGRAPDTLQATSRELRPTMPAPGPRPRWIAPAAIAALALAGLAVGAWRISSSAPVAATAEVPRTTVRPAARAVPAPPPESTPVTPITPVVEPAPGAAVAAPTTSAVAEVAPASAPAVDNDEADNDPRPAGGRSRRSPRRPRLRHRNL